MSKTTSPEILVHISAPCGARDDERYRAQVNAILGFEAASRTHCYQGYSHDDRDRDSDHDTEVASFLSDREVLWGKSSQRGNDEAASRRRSLNNDEILQTGSGHVASTSVQDSREEMRSRRPSPDVSPEVTASTNAAGSTPQQEQGQACCEADLFSPPVSVIPDSQPETMPEEAQRCVEDHISQGGIGTTFSSAKNGKRSHQISTDESGRLDQRERKRAKITSSLSNGLESHLPGPNGHGRGTSPTRRNDKLQQPSPVNDRTSRLPPLPSRQVLPLHNSFPLLIQPPPPPISCMPFTTHITPTLDMLTRRLRPERIFRPVLQTRALEPLERGYWCFDINILKHSDGDKHTGQDKDISSTARVPRTSSGADEREDCASSHHEWDVPFFNTFWSFLTDFISEGRAGWGVWCILEETMYTQTHTQPSESDTEKEKEKEKEKGKKEEKVETHSLFNLTLKVYTWGEVAAHVYLLLYLASERRVRCMGLKWRDAKGDVVVLMDG